MSKTMLSTSSSLSPVSCDAPLSPKTVNTNNLFSIASLITAPQYNELAEQNYNWYSNVPKNPSQLDGQNYSPNEPKSNEGF